MIDHIFIIRLVVACVCIPPLIFAYHFKRYKKTGNVRHLFWAGYTVGVIVMGIAAVGIELLGL